ncbi:transaldolase family protein [Wolbachia endosymbiont of Pentidionis agamae]|uniref:transaldolase family protein n=1 Tax=Wolbachia endosymbiont of Pentidionis agamae TaxID=3110435 RepID=UPI002FD0FFDE
MEIFLDSVSLDDIKEFKEFIDGITTNPSLIAKSGHKDKYEDLVHEICKTIKGPVSVEVIADFCEDMVKEGLRLAKISSNVVIKLPLTYDGLLACKILSVKHNIDVNVTLCFSSGQALLAAKSGAHFISPFVGRLDDISCDGLSLIEEICTIYSNYNFSTKVLVASVRSSLHVTESAKLGAQSVTVPTKVLKQLISHPLTGQGITIFEKDWK